MILCLDATNEIIHLINGLSLVCDVSGKGYEDDEGETDQVTITEHIDLE